MLILIRSVLALIGIARMVIPLGVGIDLGNVIGQPYCEGLLPNPSILDIDIYDFIPEHTVTH